MHFSFAQVNVSQEELFEFLEKQIHEDDIDYILKLYSEDLYENAKNLRYFSPAFLWEFYEKFSSSFSDLQIQKTAAILKNFIFDPILDNRYVKSRFFKIFCQISDFETASAIFYAFQKDFPDADYYRDALLADNSIYRENVRLLIEFATILIHTFDDKDTLLWIIQMIRKQKIRVEDPYEKWNHRNRRYARAVSDLDSEFSLFRWDFWEIKYIFNKKWLKIDVFDEMFDIFCYSLDLQQEYISWGEYDYFAKYLQKLFIAYLENIDDSIRNRDWYFRIKSHLDNYDERVLYKINISAIRKIFWLTSRDEEVWEILLSQDRKRIETLLKIESEYFLLKQEKDIKRISSENPICLFVEGKTDEKILYTAWEKLYPEEEMFFDIRFTMGSAMLKAWFDYSNKNDLGFLEFCPHQICVWMFDFDRAFEEYEKLKTWWNVDNNFPNFVKSFAHSDEWKSYVFLLPVPKFRENYASMEIKELSKLSIEFLFPDEVFLGEGNKFVQKQKFYYPSGDIELLEFNDGKKHEFSQYVRLLPAENFVNFIPIFDILRKVRDLHV